jgi:hypothetical protein
MNAVKFSVTGADTFMGAYNGDQIRLDSFTDDKDTLLYGQAVVDLRSKPRRFRPCDLRVNFDVGLNRNCR